jgi:hypothetical protein
MVVAVPQSVVLVPTALAFGVQITPPVIGLVAVLAMIMNCPIQVCFCLFDGMLALGVVVGSRLWRRPYYQAQRPCCNRRYCGLSYSLNQVPVLPFQSSRFRNLTDFIRWMLAFRYSASCIRFPFETGSFHVTNLYFFLLIVEHSLTSVLSSNYFNWGLRGSDEPDEPKVAQNGEFEISDY